MVPISIQDDRFTGVLDEFFFFIGDRCDECQPGYFDLQQMNPDGCSQCFCSGKTQYCSSHDRLNRTQIESMENWGLTSFKIAKTIVEKKPSGQEQSLPNYSGELAVQFNSYPDIDLNTNTLYFQVSTSLFSNVQ